MISCATLQMTAICNIPSLFARDGGTKIFLRSKPANILKGNDQQKIFDIFSIYLALLDELVQFSNTLI